MVRIGCNNKILEELEEIEDLLENPKTGLAEIKREIRDIEEKLDKKLDKKRDEKRDEKREVKGALTTGPLFIAEEDNHKEDNHKEDKHKEDNHKEDERAVTVVVENLGRCPIDVEVRLFDLDHCPAKEVDSAELECIKHCCAQTATLHAEEGAFEVVCCPEPENATIRAFVAVHEERSPSSEVEFVVLAAEMLPLTCPFCRKEKGRCHKEPCRECE